MAQRCVNCGLATTYQQRIRMNKSEEIKNLLQLWINPDTLSDDDIICLACWHLALNALETNDHTRGYGHKSVCIGCGKSVVKYRSYKLVLEGIPNGKYYDVVCEWLAPKQILDHHEACHRCYLKAKASRKNEQPKLSIVNLCRVCLLENEKEHMLGIFDEESDIQQKIEFCTGLLVTNDNNKPSMICTTCNSDLNSAYIFKSNYIKSDERLAKFLDKKPIKRKETLSTDNTGESQVKRIKTEFEIELNFDDVPVPFVYNEEGSTSTIENADNEVKEEIIIEDHGVTLNNDFDDTDDNLRKYFSNESEKKMSKPTAAVVNKPAQPIKLVLKTCNVCTKEFTNTKDYRNHIRTHFKPLKCEQCDEVFFSRNAKRLHLLKHSVEYFACKHCKYKTHDKDRLHKHISTSKHNAYWKPKCTVCKEIFSNETQRAKHYREEHLYETEWHCNICKAVVFEDMEEHMNLHSAPKFECHDCGHKSYTKLNIEAHIKKIHLGIVEPKKPRLLRKLAKNQRVCEICGSNFYSKQELLSHMKKHIPEYCICPVCGVKLAGTGSLNQHMDLHSNNKYECHDCGRLYKAKFHVAKHIKNCHLNRRKKIQCEICSKMMASRDILNQHIRRVHMKERNFKCLECGAMKYSQNLLKQHMFKHNGIKDFKCELCESAFARITYLKNHMLKEHGVKVPNCKSGKSALNQSSTEFIRSYLVSIGRILLPPNQSS